MQCFATEFMHGKGIVQMDIKPSNVLVRSNGYLAISDFGLAHFMDDGPPDVRRGTIGYMAPEVMRQVPYSYSADIWSLGCLMYRMRFKKVR